MADCEVVRTDESNPVETSGDEHRLFDIYLADESQSPPSKSHSSKSIELVGKGKQDIVPENEDEQVDFVELLVSNSKPIDESVNIKTDHSISVPPSLNLPPDSHTNSSSGASKPKNKRRHKKNNATGNDPDMNKSRASGNHSTASSSSSSGSLSVSVAKSTHSSNTTGTPSSGTPTKSNKVIDPLALKYVQKIIVSSPSPKKNTLYSGSTQTSKL